eukprot:TRINITY_DN33622_c0_g1_i1.p1 TRINITY_DN33622_c0_g1~~TRINITY_DN33622_c0_g1_i1.p1  ORF type:complete len:173 (-),score=29.05 TRINITY_DN33622_c0_g1_i1:52-522(-)
MDRFFDGFSRAVGSFFPAVDVQDFDKEVRVTVDVPGVSRDDLKLEVVGDTMTISGSRPCTGPRGQTVDSDANGEVEFRSRWETEIERVTTEVFGYNNTSDGRMNYSERPCGRFTRRIRLGSALDANKVSAKLRDGLLEVTVPKSNGSLRRTIEILD